MLESKHPAPILSMFEVSQIMAKVATMGRRIIRHTQNWERNVMSFRDLIHIYKGYSYLHTVVLKITCR